MDLWDGVCEFIVFLMYLGLSGMWIQGGSIILNRLRFILEMMVSKFSWLRRLIFCY